jgi:hypothetical protein
MQRMPPLAEENPDFVPGQVRAVHFFEEGMTDQRLAERIGFELLGHSIGHEISFASATAWSLDPLVP